MISEETRAVVEILIEEWEEHKTFIREAVALGDLDTLTAAGEYQIANEEIEKLRAELVE